MAVRAKLKVSRIETNDYGNGYKQTSVVFDAIYDPSIPEDQRFQKATPSASARFQIDNPAALEQFPAGAYFYLDFTPTTASGQ